MTGRVWTLILASLIGVVILIFLGIWQLQRLQWKEALLAEISSNQTRDPITLEQALAAVETGENMEFRPVSANGSFMHTSERRLLSVLDGKPAWQIVTPFQSENGIVVLVDRGAVPDEMRDTSKRNKPNPEGTQSIIAILRFHREKQGIFTPENDQGRNLFYWWDLSSMLGNANIPANARIAPFVLQLLPTKGETAYPRPQAAAVNLVNNHLQYAITWLSLAGVLVVFAGLLVRQELKKART